jgi:hypothetical protein
MEDVGLYFGNLIYFRAIWYILRSFSIFYGYLVKFFSLWYVVTRKNMATLLQRITLFLRARLVQLFAYPLITTLLILNYKFYPNTYIMQILCKNAKRS